MAISKLSRVLWDIRSEPGPYTNIELSGIDALRSMLDNLLKTPIGDRGPFFRPRWGNRYTTILQEPCNEANAELLKMYLFEDVASCIPAINVDRSTTDVVIKSTGGINDTYHLYLHIQPNQFVFAAQTLESLIVA